jgi:superfamily II DNA or RNA helicase
MEYLDFLKTKQSINVTSGFDIDIKKLNPKGFDFQNAIIKWALKKGKSALFMDTGLGKTYCQLEFAKQVCKHTKGKSLILAPLAVSKQTVQEGKKFDIVVNICRSQDDVKDGISITNYEMLEHFNPDEFVCIVLDESSIIKHFMSKTAQSMIDKFRNSPYKLACTATPSPNDYQELGTHSDFLNIMSRTEMLATFFINDAKDGQWRMKRHAEDKFWEWVSTWAMVVKNPSDLGFDGSKYELPKLNINTIIIDSETSKGSLFPKIAKTLGERRNARKESLLGRVEKVKDIMQDLENCLIWCDYNNESESIKKQLGIVEVKGSDSIGHKETSMLGFASGEIKYIVSKPSIMGFGMNFQMCNNIIFCGLSDSYERFYQAIRRCWRFGQEKEVNVWVIISEKERDVLNNINRKQLQHDKMSRAMINKTAEILKHEVQSTTRIIDNYIVSQQIKLPKWLKSEV